MKGYLKTVFKMKKFSKILKKDCENFHNLGPGPWNILFQTFVTIFFQKFHSPITFIPEKIYPWGIKI